MNGNQEPALLRGSSLRVDAQGPKRSDDVWDLLKIRTKRLSTRDLDAVVRNTLTLFLKQSKNTGT